MTIEPRQAGSADVGAASPGDITVVLNQAVGGDAQARQRLYKLLYAELLRLARSHLAGASAVSLNPSVVVHEAGGEAPITLTTGVLSQVIAAEDFTRLNDALQSLRAVDDRCFHVVEMRYFAGMTEDDIADELAVSVPTVKRDWRKARAFLFEQLR